MKKYVFYVLDLIYKADDALVYYSKVLWDKLNKEVSFKFMDKIYQMDNAIESYCKALWKKISRVVFLFLYLVIIFIIFRSTGEYIFVSLEWILRLKL